MQVIDDAEIAGDLDEMASAMTSRALLDKKDITNEVQDPMISIKEKFEADLRSALPPVQQRVLTEKQRKVIAKAKAKTVPKSKAKAGAKPVAKAKASATTKAKAKAKGRAANGCVSLTDLFQKSSSARGANQSVSANRAKNSHRCSKR